MVNNNISQVLPTIHEIESSYNNISCVLSSYNIKQVIRPYLLSGKITDEDINKRLDSFLSNIWQSNIALNDETVSIVTDYYNNYLGFDDFILEDFINFTVREDINRLVELRYIGTNKGRKEVPLSNSNSYKNLVCNFKGKELFLLGPIIEIMGPFLFLFLDISKTFREYRLVGLEAQDLDAILIQKGIAGRISAFGEGRGEGSDGDPHRLPHVFGNGIGELARPVPVADLQDQGLAVAHLQLVHQVGAEIDELGGDEDNADLGVLAGGPELPLHLAGLVNHHPVDARQAQALPGIGVVADEKDPHGNSSLGRGITGC